MKSNLYTELQARNSLRSFDRFCFRAGMCCLILATIGFGFLMAWNISIIYT